MINLYTTHCPKCNILEKKLKDKDVNYVEITDTQIMLEKGFTVVPILEVDGELLEFKQAVDWVNNYQGE